eukprot:m.513533 g.513533  ORF g.513533 m.513533 type:complete len:1874 (-) comp57442_c0_seq1:94-5715(-)
MAWLLGRSERRPVPLEEIPAWAQGEAGSLHVLARKVSVWEGDITLLRIDAIVNPSDNLLMAGGGVHKAIHAAAGPRLRTECTALSGCGSGDAKITIGCNLPSRFVIHTVGPINFSKKVLQSCYFRSLEVARINKLRTVAFPCIAAGLQGFPKDTAAELAVTVVREWLDLYHAEVDRIIFCVYDRATFKLFERVIPPQFQSQHGLTLRRERQPVPISTAGNTLFVALDSRDSDHETLPEQLPSLATPTAMLPELALDRMGMTPPRSRRKPSSQSESGTPTTPSTPDTPKPAFPDSAPSTPVNLGLNGPNNFFARLASQRSTRSQFATATTDKPSHQSEKMRKNRRFSLEIGGLSATQLACVGPRTTSLSFEEYWIDDGAFAVRWGSGLIRVSAIQKVIIGQQTPTFSSCPLPDVGIHASKSFSIIFLPNVQDAVKQVLVRALGADFETAFHKADTNGDGSLSADEVAQLLFSVSGVMPSGGELHQLFASIDANGDGTLAIDELRSWKDTLVQDVDVCSLDLVVKEECDLQRWVQKLNALVAQCEHRLLALRRGTFMHLVTPNETYSCRVILTPTLDVVWTPMSGETGTAGSLPLAAVKFMRIGQQTESFRQAQNVAGESQRSFSLVYGGDFRTLDLITDSDEDYRTWVTELRSLVTLAAECQERMMAGAMITIVAPSAKKQADPQRFALNRDKSVLVCTMARQKPMKIPIEAIRELRLGQHTETFAKRPDLMPFQALSFSVIHDDDFRELNLMFHSADEFDAWATGLQELIFSLHDSRNISFYLTKLQLKEIFTMYDDDDSGTLDLNEILNILKAFNASLYTLRNIQLIDEFIEREGVDGEIGLKGFLRMYARLSVWPYLVEVMLPYATPLTDEPVPAAPKGELDLINSDRDGDFRMSVQDLQRFLVTEQRLSSSLATLELCTSIIRKYEPRAGRLSRRNTGITEVAMSQRGFSAFMFSGFASIIGSAHRARHTMTDTLPNYFVSSSHNTYLLDSQVTGRSSCEAYIRALSRDPPCRCIEIDTHDGPNNDPIVTHGSTLTSKIQLREVIQCIAKYAFKKSAFPLIISIENHCGLLQQRVMAHYFRTIFRSMLVEDHPDSTEMPSPHDLRYKILIKCKRPLARDTKFVLVDASDTIVSEVGGEKGFKLSRLAEICKRKGISTPKVLAQEFAQLAVFTLGSSFSDFQQSRHPENARLLCSLQENKMTSFATDPVAALELVEYTKRQILRVYPAGSRFDSSNFDPWPYWICGAQLVALNYQTDSTPIQLNQALFRGNAAFGYVLKPSFLRCPQPDFLPHMIRHLPVRGSAGPTHLSITVISAQGLPLSATGGIVSLDIFGIPADGMHVQTLPWTARDQQPAWKQTFQLSATVPEITLLRISLKCNSFFAENSFLVQDLEYGFRMVHLLKSSGEPASVTLLLHLEIRHNFAHSEAWWQQLSDSSKEALPTRARVAEHASEASLPLGDRTLNRHRQFSLGPADANSSGSATLTSRVPKSRAPVKASKLLVPTGLRHIDESIPETNAILEQAYIHFQSMLELREKAEAPTLRRLSTTTMAFHALRKRLNALIMRVNKALAAYSFLMEESGLLKNAVASLFKTLAESESARMNIQYNSAYLRQLSFALETAGEICKKHVEDNDAVAANSDETASSEHGAVDPPDDLSFLPADSAGSSQTLARSDVSLAQQISAFGFTTDDTESQPSATPDSSRIASVSSEDDFFTPIPGSQTASLLMRRYPRLEAMAEESDEDSFAGETLAQSEEEETFDLPRQHARGRNRAESDKFTSLPRGMRIAVESSSPGTSPIFEGLLDETTTDDPSIRETKGRRTRSVRLAATRNRPNLSSPSFMRGSGTTSPLSGRPEGIGRSQSPTNDLESTA